MATLGRGGSAQNSTTCQHGRGASAYILSAHQQMKGRKLIPPTQAHNRARHQPEKTANPRPYQYKPQHTRNSCRAGEYFVLVSFTFNLASGHHRNSTALHFDSQRLPGTRHRGIISVGPSGDVTGEPDIRWISVWISVVADSLNLAAHTNKADIANTK